MPTDVGFKHPLRQAYADLTRNLRRPHVSYAYYWLTTTYAELTPLLRRPYAERNVAYAESRCNTNFNTPKHAVHTKTTRGYGCVQEYPCPGTIL